MSLTPTNSSYEISGESWLRNVPQGWTCEPLKRVAKLNTVKVHPQESVLYVGMENVQSDNGQFNPTFEQLPEGLSLEFRENDVLFGKLRPYLAKSWLASFDGICSSEFLVLRAQKVSPRFLNYVTLSREFIEVVDSSTYGAKMPRASWDFVGLLKIPVPGRELSKQIASFLDYETAKIDALIEKQQQLIALLGEKCQAVISHAVTKGLNPDAPMRDSGVEWLGQVPEYWKFGPLKRFWPVIDCKHVTVPFYDEGFPVASVMEVRTFELDLSRVLRTDKANYELLKSGGREPKQGDVIYCRNTANTGTSAYVGTDEPICIGQDVVLIKSREQNGRYLNYILHGPEMSAQLSQYMVGSTFKRINVADIRELIVTCPPRVEQDKLVEYLDKKASQFDGLMRNAYEMVEVLQERRTALISAAVTGKIDVRRWKRPSASPRKETEMDVA